MAPDKGLRWGLFLGAFVGIIVYNVLQTSDCKFSLESPEKVIEQEDYPVESHTVETEDGYLLTAHRLPNSAGIPVYLQHGLLSSSLDWLKNGRNRSLAFFLWDNGFDVWIGNSRGNAHSKRHKSLLPNDRQFWNFSYHEMGMYDDAAFVRYVSQTTGRKVFYVGYSMGATSFSIMASTRPKFAEDRVAAMIALAPAVYFGRMESTFGHLLARYRKQLKFLADTIGMHEFLGQNIVSDIFADRVCSLPYLGNWLCSNIIFIFVGPKQLDYARLPIYFSKWPSGTSYKSFCHILQFMAADEFQNFDYGPEGNLVAYDSPFPQIYNLSSIRVPTAMFISEVDHLVNYQDALRYYNQLPNKLGLHYVDNQFTHGDFIIGINATELVYNEIVKVIHHVSTKDAANAKT